MTGVQTCALPISQRAEEEEDANVGRGVVDGDGCVGDGYAACGASGHIDVVVARAVVANKFETRREG